MAEYPAMNLEDALRSEALSALQLWLNLEYMSGQNHLGGGAAPPGWGYSDWPHPIEVYYATSNDDNTDIRYVRMTNIRAKRITDIDWEEEDVHDRVIDVVYERAYNVPPGQEQDAEYDFEFDAITTRSRATTLALENALKERLGGTAHPVGLENTTTVKAAVENKYGTENDYKQRFTDKSVIKGPIDVILRGQRSRARVSQATRCIPEFEYDLYIGYRQGGISPTGLNHHYYNEVHFTSKDEFNAFIQGRGSDEAGVVYQFTTLVGPDQLRKFPMAEASRNHRQNASISNHKVPIIFSEPFDDQVQQGVLWIDRRTNEEIDPFNYHPMQLGGFIDDALDRIAHPEKYEDC